MRIDGAAGLLMAAILLLTGCGPGGILIGSGAVVARSVVQERTTADAIDDTGIAIAIATGLLEESPGLFSDVGVDVVEGRVVLTGSVPDPIDKITAMQTAWRVDGVSSVDDAMTVGPDGGIVVYAEDVVISNTLRLRLFGDPEVSALNYNTVTIAGVVHITGLARSGAELSRVLAHGAAIPGVVRVVSHVLTIDDPRRTKGTVTTG